MTPNIDPKVAEDEKKGIVQTEVSGEMKKDVFGLCDECYCIEGDSFN